MATDTLHYRKGKIRKFITFYNIDDHMKELSKKNSPNHNGENFGAYIG